jgi:hypothetical protein
MLKKIILLIAFSIILNAKLVIGLSQSIDKEQAIQDAHWKCFEKALTEIAGQQSYIGKVKKSFRTDYRKDFLDFKSNYFDFSTYKCQNKGNDGFICQVTATINVEKLRAYMSEKVNSSTTMGKNRVGKLNIVLIDNISTRFSKDFISYIQSDVNNSGHSLYVLPKGTPVGSKGNKCQELKEQQKYFKRKGSAYKKALYAVNDKLKSCNENKDVEYLFELNELTFKTIGKTTHNDIIGTLHYRINMLNTKTGKSDHAIKALLLKSIASDTDSLRYKLFEKAGKTVSKELTSNILSSISTKSKNKKFSKVDKYEYMYTLILRGLTNDRTDRNKIKIVKKTISKLNLKLRKNRSESSDQEVVYNFGSNEEVDIENLMYEMYDIADSIGMNIKITDEDDDILVIQFQ